MGRQPCCEKEAVKKGPWSVEEDRKLVSFITAHGHGCWREVPKRAGLQRCGKSCRLRWINYLRPDLKRGMLSPQEESLIIQLHAALGNKWSRIAARLPGRTDNEIKNCWNTRIKKKMREMGVDPVTHNPISELETSTVTDSAENEGLAPAIPAALNAPLIFIQTTGVSGPSSAAGYPPSFSHTDTLNAMAHIYNMPLARRLHEGLAAGTPPGSVMNSQVESSLSHTPPTTKYEDEHSNNSCADSVSQDQTIRSNLVSDHGSNVLHLPLTCQIPPHQLHAQPHVQHNPTQVHLLPNSPYVCRCQGMSTPLQTSQNATHVQNALHLLPQVPHRGAPPIPLHPIHLSQPHPSSLQTAPHLPVYQLEGLQMPLPSFSKGTEGSEKPSSSSNNIGVSRLKEGEEGDIRTDDESMSCTTDISSRTIKTDVNERAGLSQALQWEIKAEEKAGDSGVANVGGGQYWSAMMSDQAFLSDALGGEPEQLLQAMSPLELHEASQAIIGQQNFGSAGNYPLINVGSWSNIDCLVSEPNMVTKYSLY